MTSNLIRNHCNGVPHSKSLIIYIGRKTKRDTIFVNNKLFNLDHQGRAVVKVNIKFGLILRWIVTNTIRKSAGIILKLNMGSKIFHNYKAGSSLLNVLSRILAETTLLLEVKISSSLGD